MKRLNNAVTRYGHPVNFTEADPTKTPFGTVTFAAGAYALTVFLLIDKEVGARVFKVDKSAFTPAEMQTILGADTDGTPWTVVASSDPNCLQWTRGDKATALYDKPKKMLIFTSVAMAQALKAMPDVPAAPSPTNAVATPSAVTPTPSLPDSVNTNATIPSPTTPSPVQPSGPSGN